MLGALPEVQPHLCTNFVERQPDSKDAITRTKKRTSLVLKDAQSLFIEITHPHPPTRQKLSTLHHLQ